MSGFLLPEIEYHSEKYLKTSEYDMKLSRTGWNNVLIFSIMAYILLINTTHKSLFGDSANEKGLQKLLPENAVILALKVNQEIEIERIGQSWRTRPTNQMSAQALAAMMMTWHSVEGLPMAQAPVMSSNSARVVSITLAGEVSAYIMQFYQDEQQVVVYNQTTQAWATLAPEIYQQLFPIELIPHA